MYKIDIFFPHRVSKDAICYHITGVWSCLVGWSVRQSSYTWLVKDLLSCQTVNAITHRCRFTSRGSVTFSASRSEAETVPSFLLCDFHTGSNVKYWHNIPTLKRQWEWGCRRKCCFSFSARNKTFISNWLYTNCSSLKTFQSLSTLWFVSDLGFLTHHCIIYEKVIWSSLHIADLNISTSFLIRPFCVNCPPQFVLSPDS